MRLRPVALVAILVGILTVPLAAEAQPERKTARIGYLGVGSPSEHARQLESFRQGLRERGYVEGRNISVDYRWAEGRLEQLPALARELIQLGVEVIVTANNAAVAACQQATRTVPIVAAVMGNPVGSGFVASLARPGGNITGFASLQEGLAGKRLELLREVAPTIFRVAVLAVSQTPAHRIIWNEMQAAAQILKISLLRQEIAGPAEIEQAFAALIQERPQALVVLQHAATSVGRTTIVGLAAKHRLPTIYADRHFVDAGGFMSYGTNQFELYRQVVKYVDKILKGANPGDLPIEQPTTFELVINLKTAKALGLTIPPSLLLRADQVIDP